MIGSKKFKALKEKLFEAGFSNNLSQSYDALRTRLHDEKIKFNMTKASNALGIEYMQLRKMIGKGSRMPQDYHDLIIKKLKEVKA